MLCLTNLTFLVSAVNFFLKVREKCVTFEIITIIIILYKK